MVDDQITRNDESAQVEGMFKQSAIKWRFSFRISGDINWARYRVCHNLFAVPS